MKKIPKFSCLKRKFQRRSFKFLNYSLLSGRPLLVVGAPSMVSKTLFKKIIMRSGNCFSNSFYSAKALNSSKIPLVTPSAFLVLTSFGSQKSFDAFLVYARSRQIPVINLSGKASNYSDYSISFQFKEKKAANIFLSWVLCQLFSSSYSRFL